MEANQITLQSILQQGYTVDERHHPLPGYVRRAVQAILSCRTARLGGHVQACPEGHLERLGSNACRHRMCPPCAWVQVEGWLITQQARLLAWDHDHVMFTLPSDRHGLGLANVAVMTTLLFASVRATWLALLGDPKDRGATPGIIATLPTWSQTLLLPPQLHGLVTGGGLSRTGQGVAVRHGFWLPSRVVMALFRGKLRAAIDTAVREGQLVMPGGLTRRHGETLRHKLGRQKWNVHIRERSPHGEGVRVSLARSIRGGPMANTRVVSCAPGAVTCRYRLQGEGSAGGRRGLMTVPRAEVVRRSLRHVPAAGTRVVRSSGLYAPTKREALACCRAQVGHGPVEVPAVLDGQTAWSQQGRAPPDRCPLCGRRLVRRGLIPPSRRPPPEARPAEAGA